MNEKKCSKCKEEKPRSAFYTDKNRKDGLQYWCRKCTNKDQKRRNNTPEGKAKKRSYYASPGVKQRQALNHLKSRYGVSPEEYKRKLAEQKGVCAICGNPETTKLRGKVWRLCVDHDHNTGQVRGLLCRDCNTSLGYLQEDTLRIAKMIVYIDKYKTKAKSVTAS